MIFKIHYGLWYGGLVGIIPFTFNYAVTYCGATGVQNGVLFTILPLIALVAKPIVCSYADKYAAHRRCLLTFMYLAILGYGSLAIYPFFPDLIKNHQTYVWFLYCFGAFLGNTSMCVVNSLGDSLAINSCTRKKINYGQYRLWGPVGFGVFGAIWGLCNTVSFLPPYTPGILTMIVIISINSVILLLWRDAQEFKVLAVVTSTATSSTQSSLTANSNDGQAEAGTSARDQEEVVGEQNEETVVDLSKRLERVQLLWRLGYRHKSIFMYIFIFTLCGLLTGIHWQFFFEYLKKMADDSNQNFSTLATLVLPVQSLGGELIFFMLSGRILKKLGSMMTLVICLFSFAARYLMYAYLIPHVNIYWILPVELLQGPAFGLMYCVLTHQANLYSEQIDGMIGDGSIANDIKLKRSLHATLQGILGASFEGLGLGLGALIGGLAYDVTPILMWQIAGYSALVASTIYLIGGLALRRSV